MIEVIPAILVKTAQEFERMVRRLEGHTAWAHIDIIDGEFAPNTTIKGYEELLAIETPLRFEVHLMVQKPADVLPHWYPTKAERYIIHAESEGDHGAIITDITEHGKQGVLAFNPETDADRFEALFPHCHHVQFMTVHPGFYGSPFVESSVEKIADFHMRHAGVPIAVDGGITPEIAPKVITAGATILVSGSYITHSEDISKAIEILQNI